jgi:hypothetical protein
VTVPPTHPRPLEPWALELLRQDRTGDDPRAQEELAQLVALLRALPDPERSPDLARRILDRVAEQESRPRVVRVAFAAARRLSHPSAATLLAAGVAALLALVGTPEWLPSIWGNEPLPRVTVTEAAPLKRRPTALVRPQFVSAFAQTAAVEPRVFRVERAPIDEAFEARLDRQLNQLMIDPTAFATRLEQIAQRDEFIARLAQRAAERGDAPEIALRVRASDHPLAPQIVDRLLRATLVASVSPR